MLRPSSARVALVMYRQIVTSEAERLQGRQLLMPLSVASRQAISCLHGGFSAASPAMYAPVTASTLSAVVPKVSVAGEPTTVCGR